MADNEPQDVAEALDPEVFEDYDDPEGALQFPPEELTGADAYGTTAAEERVDEPLAERVAREELEPRTRPTSRSRDRADRDDRRGVGRLTASPDDDVPLDLDDEADAVAWGEEADDLSAEEQAMHITGDPRMGRPGDGYLR